MGGRRIGAAAMAAFMMTACEPKAVEPQIDTTPATDPAPAPEPVSGDPRFADALSYDCEGGGSISIAFDRGGDGPVLVEAADGAVHSLSPEQESGELAYTDGTHRLVMTGPGVLWSVGGEPGKACEHIARDLPPPTAPGVVRTVLEADAGAEVRLKVGEKVAIALVGVPTAGYLWAPENPPDFLKAAGETGGPTSTAQRVPGFAGGSHWEVVIFEAASPGKGKLKLAQRRPWEDASEPAADRFEISVVVE